MDKLQERVLRTIHDLQTAGRPYALGHKTRSRMRYALVPRFVIRAEFWEESNDRLDGAIADLELLGYVEKRPLENILATRHEVAGGRALTVETGRAKDKIWVEASLANASGAEGQRDLVFVAGGDRLDVPGYRLTIDGRRLLGDQEGVPKIPKARRRDWTEEKRLFVAWHAKKEQGHPSAVDLFVRQELEGRRKHKYSADDRRKLKAALYKVNQADVVRG